MNDFDKKLAFSQGERKDEDIDTIASILPGCVKVVKTGSDLDKKGVDYVATLHGGAEVLIDAKRREPNCSRFWKNGDPELPMEYWSVAPFGKYNTPPEKAKNGWTISDSTMADMILFTFDAVDTQKAFLIGFQSLRMAFLANLSQWPSMFPVKVQDSGKWQSLAVFVPATVVLDAIKATSVYVRGEDLDLVVSPQVMLSALDLFGLTPKRDESGRVVLKRNYGDAQYTEGLRTLCNPHRVFMQKMAAHRARK